MALSENRRKRLLQEFNQSCYLNSDPQEPTINFETEAIYDIGTLIQYGPQQVSQWTENKIGIE